MDENISTVLGVMMDSHVTNDVIVDSFPTNQTVDMTDVAGSVDDHLQMTRFVVQRILVPTVMSVGVIGNVISICVLVQRSMTSSTNCYLTALAAFDLLYLVFSFTLSWNHYESIKLLEAYKYWFPYGRVFADISGNVSVYLTVTFSFERLIAVCFPMKGRIICTPQRARIISLIVILVVTTLTSLEFFEWKTVRISHENTTILETIDTEFAKTKFYRIGYYYFLVVFFTFLPLVLLTLFNGLLIRSVFTAIKLRRRMTQVSTQTPSETSRRHREQHKITAMLIGVVVVFLVCQTPNAALLIYHTYLNLYGERPTTKQRNHLRIAGNVVNLLILINASVNFIFYSCMSTKFRRVFLRLFCRFTSYAKRDISRTYSSYYGNTGMTSRSPKSSIRLTSEQRNNRSNQISGRCAHLRQIVDKNATDTQVSGSISGEKWASPGVVHVQDSSSINGRINSNTRPHIKYTACEHTSDSDDCDLAQTDLSLEQMARARERGSQKCQCFHIKTFGCLEKEDSTSFLPKIADTSI